MTGLKTQESKEFVAFFKIVQAEALKENKIFFLDAGDGRDINLPGISGEDLMGWLIPIDMADDFKKYWLLDDVNDDWSDYFMFAIWEKDEDEIKIRKAFGYAPFNNMISVVVSGENENLVKKNIQNMYDSIIYLLKGRGITDFEFILGPNPCSISKINQNYRWQILFKDDNIEINLLKGIIKYICITKRDVVFSKEINISIDINPNSVL